MGQLHSRRLRPAPEFAEAADQAADAKAGWQLVGDSREFEVTWSGAAWWCLDVSGETEAGPFPTSEAAYRWGLARFG